MRRLALWGLAAVFAGLPTASAQVEAHASARAQNEALASQIEQLSAELKTKPNDALLYHKRGELHRAQRDYAHALADYAEAEILEPYLELIYLSRGRVFYETGRLPEAYRALTQFLQMAPGHADALLLRARTRIQLGQRNAAELDFAEALAHSKAGSAETSLERAANLSQLGKAGPALAVLEEAIVHFGPLASLEDAALAIELRAKRWPQALQRIEALLPKSEHKVQLLAHKAQILEAVGDRAAARAVRREALLQIAGLPETEQKRESTRKLAQQLESGLARAEPAGRK